MPQLDWDELDFLTFFAVIPAIEEHAVAHSYELERNGLRFLFTLWQHESVIQLSLFRGKNHDPLVTFTAYVRGKAHCIDDKRGKYIDFDDCVIVPNRFWHFQAIDVFDRMLFPAAVTIRLIIDPDIQINLL